MRSVRVLIAVLAALMLSQTAVAAPTWVLVDTLTVPATGGSVTSAVTLGAGDNYLFEALGTFDAGASITADAEYSSGPTSFAWQDLVEGYESYGEGLLELRVDGSFVEWGAFNPNHVYTLAQVGAGSTVAFDIYDTYGANNVGALTVNIYQDVVPAPGAILLSTLGAGLVGWLRRRRAL
jgi:hypothetical protein